MPTFRQNSTCKKITKEGNKEQIFSYSRVINLYPLKERPEKKVFYDKELKMHFESNQTFQSYQLEVLDVELDFDREIRNTIDFRRRLNYRYDWLVVERSKDNGKITSVENLSEVRANWLQLEERIKKDYVGKATDKYLANISSQFSEDKHFKDIFNQYIEFGLLFMEVPSKHNNSWMGKRTVSIDNNSDFNLTELTELVAEDDKFKTYRIKLMNPPISPIVLLEGKGELIWNKKTNLPETVSLAIKYYYDDTITNEWTFEMERITE